MAKDIQLLKLTAELEKLKTENKNLKTQLRNERILSKQYKMLSRQLNLLIEITGLGTWDYNHITNELLRNDNWYTQLGYDRDDIENTPNQFYQLVHPKDVKKVELDAEMHSKNRLPFYNAEYRMKSKDGSWKWILNSGKVIERDKKGNPIRTIGTHLDITKIKEYQQSIKEKQQQYKALFEYAPIGLWEQDISELLAHIKKLKVRKIGDFRTFFENNPNEVIECISKIKPFHINKAALEIHDAKNISEIKDNFVNVFTEKSKRIFIDQLVALIRGDDYFEAETETQTIKGRIKQLKITISFKPLPIQNKKLILFALKDISEQKSAEKALIESENRYRSLYRISPTGIMIEDSNGNIIDANPALHESFGYKGNELIGKNVKMLAHHNMWNNIKGNLNNILSGITLKHIVKGVKKDGTTIFNELYETKLSLPSIGDAILCLSNDITQQINIENKLKANEKQYRYLFFQNPLPMYIIDAESLKFLAINESAMNKYGYTWEELMEKTMLDFYQSADAEKVKLDLSKLQNGLGNRGVWQNKLKNGEKIFVEVTVNSLEYFGREGILILANDISERIKAEEQLANNQNQIRKFASHLEKVREEERTHIAREIHDNLGQSLTAIKLDISWLANNSPKNKIKFQKKINLAKELVDNSIETIQKISTSLRPKLIDDLGLAPSLEWLVGDFKNRTDISYSLDISPKNLSMGKDLAVNLFRIVQEALTNIVRHANADQVSIRLNLINNYLQLIIADNGVGITKEQQSRTNSFGLIGINERVIKFKGKVNISGNKGKGTIIKIKIPLN